MRLLAAMIIGISVGMFVATSIGDFAGGGVLLSWFDRY